MSQPDYSQFSTERIHDGLNFNRNHRFYLVYGHLTADEFLTKSMFRSRLRETLWATLKLNKIERVIFYNAADKFFFLDEESANLAQELGKARKPDPPVSASSARSRMQPGPLGKRNVLTGPTRMVTPNSGVDSASTTTERDPGSQATNKSNAPAGSKTSPQTEYAYPREIPMARAGRGGMADAAVLTTFNDFIRDGAVRTAIVIEDLENLALRFESRITDQLAARLRDWNALPSANRNVMIFITSREPIDAQTIDSMKIANNELPEIANLTNMALGERKAEAEGFVWYVPPPFEEEIQRLLDDVRIRKEIPLDWEHRDRLARWLSAENKPLRIIDGFFTEYSGIGGAENKRLSPEVARQLNWLSGNADPRPALVRLDELVGLTEVKAEIRRLANYFKAQKLRQAQDPAARYRPITLHLALTGNPGTGKTTVAKLIGEIYRDIGLLRRGHTVECPNAAELVGEYVGVTEQKTNALINRALDGVLFIDEAPGLITEGTRSFGQAAIKTLVARTENERHRLMVIIAGYPQEMKEFIASDAGLSERFATQIELPDFEPSELLQIFDQSIRQENLFVSEATHEAMRAFFLRLHQVKGDKNYFPLDEHGKPSFRNAGTVRNLVDEMMKRQSDRLGGDVEAELTLADIPERFRGLLPGIRQPEGGELELRRLLAKLDQLVGLREVKQFVAKLVKEQQLAILLNRDLTATGKTRHMLFTGNPGTGKTTVARLIGAIYKELGILKKGHFVEAQRKDLIGRYQGFTDHNTNKIVEDSLDGVLFIDEVYSLSRDEHDTYGQQAIDGLVPVLENHRDRLVVIFAGYTREMQDFIDANSGMESRIGYSIEFPDFTAEELCEVFLGMAAEDGYRVPDDVRSELLRQFERLSENRGPRFGNARDVRVRFYQRMVESADERLLEVIHAGQEPTTFDQAFVLADVPQLGADGK
jgi:SpoVK/Ycf46/Vps4 family AAA+-type ATPase